MSTLKLLLDSWQMKSMRPLELVLFPAFVRITFLTQSLQNSNLFQPFHEKDIVFRATIIIPSSSSCEPYLHTLTLSILYIFF